MPTLSADQKSAAKAFFYSLLYVASTDTEREASPVFQGMSPNYKDWLVRKCRGYLTTQIQQLFEVTIAGKATLENIKSIQNTLEMFHKRVNKDFLQDITGTDLIQLELPVLFNYFAWVCSARGFIWDNTATDPAEFVQIVETDLGEALATFNCFTNPLYTGAGKAASVDNTPQAVAKVTKNSKAGASARKVPKYDPVRAYRTLGPLSGNLRNLKNPNKVTFTNPMLCIEADNPNNTTKRTLFITPLDVFGASTRSTQVKLGAANGYSDCQLWWADYNAAKLVLDEVASENYYVKNRRYGDTYQIKKAKPDANGYFYVDTDVGPAYIKASKVNEALEETLEPSENITTNNTEDISESNETDFMLDTKAFVESFGLYWD